MTCRRHSTDSGKYIPVLAPKSGRVKTYSTVGEVQQMPRSQQTPWYRWLNFLPMLEVVLTLAATVWFAATAVNSNWLSELLRSLLARNSIFFNPSPGIFLMVIGTSLLIAFGGLTLSSYCNVLLPPRVKAYMATMGKGRSPGIRAESVASTVRNISIGVGIFSLLLVTAALPLFASVSNTGIDHVSTYPFHEQLSLDGTHMLNVTCSVVNDGKSTRRVRVVMVSKSAKADIPLMSASDGGLPMPFISIADINALYHAFERRGIPVNRDGSESCATAAAEWWTPQATVQYDALFR